MDNTGVIHRIDEETVIANLTNSPIKFQTFDEIPACPPDLFDEFEAAITRETFPVKYGSCTFIDVTCKVQVPGIEILESLHKIENVNAIVVSPSAFKAIVQLRAKNTFMQNALRKVVKLDHHFDVNSYEFKFYTGKSSDKLE